MAQGKNLEPLSLVSPYLQMGIRLSVRGVATLPISVQWGLLLSSPEGTEFSGAVHDPLLNLWPLNLRLNGSQDARHLEQEGTWGFLPRLIRKGGQGVTPPSLTLPSC